MSTEIPNDKVLTKLKPKLRSKLHSYLKRCLWEKAVERIKQNCNVSINPNSFHSKSEYDQFKKILKTKVLPKEVNYRDEFDCLPLYIALQYSGPFHLIQLLVKANEKAIKQKWNIGGGYPLHIACAPKDPIHNDQPKDIDNNQAKIIRFLCEKNMEVIDVSNEDGMVTPLHLLCEHNPPLRLVDFFLKCSIDKYSSFALSCSKSIANTNSKEFMDKEDNVDRSFSGLTSSNNSSCSIVQMKDDQGRLPFHIAIDYQADTSVIERLYNANKDCIKIRQCVDSNLPIHIAVSAGCSPKVLKILLEKYPQSLSKKGAYNDTPFHLLWWQYERKFHSMTGKPKEKKQYCDAEYMLRVMIQEYYCYCCSKYKDKNSEYVTKAKRNLIHLLTSTKDHHLEQSFVHLMENKHETYGLPRQLMTFIYNIIHDTGNWEETLEYHNVSHTQKCNEANGEGKQLENNLNSIASQDNIMDNISETISLCQNEDVSLPVDHVEDEMKLSLEDTETDLEDLWNFLENNTCDDDDGDDDEEEKTEKARVRAYAHRHLNALEEKSITIENSKNSENSENSDNNGVVHENSQSIISNSIKYRFNDIENDVLEQYFSQTEDFAHIQKEDRNKKSRDEIIRSCKTSQNLNQNEKQNEMKMKKDEKKSTTRIQKKRKNSGTKSTSINMIDLSNREKNVIDLADNTLKKQSLASIKSNDDMSCYNLKSASKRKKLDVMTNDRKKRLRAIISKRHEDNESWNMKGSKRGNKRKQKNEELINIQNESREETRNKEKSSYKEKILRKSTRLRSNDAIYNNCDESNVLDDDFLITV